MCYFFSSLLEKSKPSVSQMKKESYVEISIVNFKGNKSERQTLQDTEIGVRWVYRQSVSQSRQISFVNYFHSPPVVFISY